MMGDFSNSYLSVKISIISTAAYILFNTVWFWNIWLCLVIVGVFNVMLWYSVWDFNVTGGVKTDKKYILFGIHAMASTLSPIVGVALNSGFIITS